MASSQDVYRRLAALHAFDGILRLRTSSEFRVSRAFGQLTPDDRFDNLVHVTAADPSSSYAFDFEYASAGGFSSHADIPPVLQMVFQYSCVVPRRGREGEDKGEGRWVLQRRLRILTLQAHIACTPQEVYGGVDADAVLVLLAHKISAASAAEGLAEGRALLQDWLVLFTANYNINLSNSRGVPIESSSQVEVTFDEAEALQTLPRLVFALLRSPLLSPRELRHPDARAVTGRLWAALPPDHLRRAVYPALSSFADPDTLAFPRHSLSQAALVTTGAPIFLLDAFTALLVYYIAAAPPHLPFPPPQQSRLRAALNAARQGRRVTPSVAMMRGGVDDISAFTELLIEEPDEAGGQPGFVQFLEEVRQQVWGYLHQRLRR